MSDWLLIYIRLISYIVVLVTNVLSISRCPGHKALSGNVIMSVGFIVTLMFTRFYITDHSPELASVIMTISVIIWAVFHFADFINLKR